MCSVNLYSTKSGEIFRFLQDFFANLDFDITDDLKWKKRYNNPIELTDMIGVFIDNNDKYALSMWICLDENVYINITPTNSDSIIRYLFERYPY